MFFGLLFYEFLKVDDFSFYRLLIKFNLDLLFVLFVSFFDFFGDFALCIVFLLFKYSPLTI